MDTPRSSQYEALQGPYTIISSGGPTHFAIDGQVKINLSDGSMTFDPAYTPSEAAKQFWTALSEDYRKMLKWKDQQTSRSPTMDEQTAIDLLTLHRDRLQNTKTFEEYRDAHVAYVDMLIGMYKAEMERTKTIEMYIKYVEPFLAENKDPEPSK